jgi:hypothetical protein
MIAHQASPSGGLPDELRWRPGRRLGHHVVGLHGSGIERPPALEGRLHELDLAVIAHHVADHRIGVLLETFHQHA